jgi:DNA-binding transcriptional MocR family regulator
MCGDLYFTGTRPKAVQAFDRKGLVLYCSSFSKDISPISRAGWLAPGKFYKLAHDLKRTLNGGTAIVPQLALARFLAGGAATIICARSGGGASTRSRRCLNRFCATSRRARG